MPAKKPTKAPTKAAPARVATATKAPAKKTPSRAGSTRPDRAKAPAKKTAKAASTKNASATKASTSARSTTARKSTTKAAVSGKGAAAKRTAPGKAAAGGARPAPARKPAKRSAAVDKFFESQRLTLLEERATYTHQAESLRAEADLLAAEREPGDVQFDEESGEGDTLAVERERDLALSAQAQAAVEDIDRALTRIEDGSYGTCEQCGEPIPRERLRALPYAALCVRCKSGGLGRR